MSFSVWDGDGPTRVIEGDEATCCGFLSGADRSKYGTLVMLSGDALVSVTAAQCDCTVYDFDVDKEIERLEDEVSELENKVEGLEEKLAEKEREVERLTPLATKEQS